MRHSPFAVAAMLAGLPAVAQNAETLPAGQYLSDPAHTMVTFHIDHLGLQSFTATFDTVEAKLEIDPANPEEASLTATVQVASLDLPSPPEGFHASLMTTPWFQAEAHPAMTFTSSGVTMTGERTADVAGTLSLNGVEGPLSLQVTFNGGYAPGVIEPTPRMGFSATGTLNRSDFAMGAFVPEAGSTLGVGDEITFEIETEFSGPAPD